MRTFLVYTGGYGFSCRGNGMVALCGSVLWPRWRSAGVSAPLFFALLLLVQGRASAHTRTATLSEIAIEERQVRWTLRVPVADLIDPLALAPAAPVAAVVDGRDRAREYLGARLGVSGDGQPCPSSRSSVAAPALEPGATEPRMIFAFAFTCPTTPGRFDLDYRLFFDLDPMHTGFARVSPPGEEPITHLFRMGAESLSVAGPPDAWRATLQYLALGIEHIFLGYDHLAFLGALILGTTLARRRRRQSNEPPVAASRKSAIVVTLKIVTSFTVAHSITLIYAALRPGTFVVDWVEPAIALSVAFVGFENLWPRVPRCRWMLTFAFGLVHGFGFASVLQEIGLPRSGLVRSLLAFNLGVELGQVAVVSAALPILLWLATRDPLRFERWILRGCSLGLGAAGLTWFALRVS